MASVIGQMAVNGAAGQASQTIAEVHLAAKAENTNYLGVTTTQISNRATSEWKLWLTEKALIDGATVAGSVDQAQQYAQYYTDLRNRLPLPSSLVPTSAELIALLGL